MNTHKYPTWDRNRSAFLKVGFIVALLSVIIIFQTESMVVTAEEYQVLPEDDILIEPIRTPHSEKVKTPPIKAPEPEDIIEKIDEQDDFVEAKEEPIQDDNVITKESTEEFFVPTVDTTTKTKVTPPAPKPEPVPEPEVELVFRAERMPCFATCSQNTDESERRKCTEEALLSFIYSKLRYPIAAKENGIEGGVVTSFVVDKDGNVKDIKTKRDIGGGCGKEIRNILSQLPKWSPGKQNGRPVHVQYTIPIKFKLD